MKNQIDELIIKLTKELDFVEHYRLDSIKHKDYDNISFYSGRKIQLIAVIEDIKKLKPNELQSVSK